MKRIISFEKKLEFSSMIGEVTSISLDHTLQLTNPNTIEGTFNVTGTYKLTEASCIEENFNFQIPTEIILNEVLDKDTTKIEIDDFYYEIENEENLICYIDVLVEGVEIIEEEPEIEQLIESPKDERECDGDYNQVNDIEENTIIQEELEQTKQEETMTKEIIEVEQTQIPSLFTNLSDDEDTFTTYSVYILRQEDTLQTIIEKYKVTKEQLEDYNDLSNITIGSKIIIPVNG